MILAVLQPQISNLNLNPPLRDLAINNSQYTIKIVLGVSGTFDG